MSRNIQIPNERKSLGMLGIGGNPFRNKQLNEYLNDNNKIAEEIARRNMMVAKQYDADYSVPENPTADLTKLNGDVENAIEIFNQGLDNALASLENEEGSQTSFDDLNKYNRIMRYIQNNAFDNASQSQFISLLQQSQSLLSSIITQIHTEMMSLFDEIESGAPDLQANSRSIKNYSTLMVIYSLMLENIMTSKIKPITINDIRDNYNTYMKKAFPANYNEIADIILSETPEVQKRFKQLEAEYGHHLSPEEKKRVTDLYTSKIPIETFLNKDVLRVLQNNDGDSDLSSLSDSNPSSVSASTEPSSRSSTQPSVSASTNQTNSSTNDSDDDDDMRSLMEKLKKKYELSTREKSPNVEFTDEPMDADARRAYENYIKTLPSKLQKPKKGKGMTKKQLLETHFVPQSSDMVYNSESNNRFY